MTTQLQRDSAIHKLSGAISRSRSHDPAAESFRLKVSTFVQVLQADPSLIEWTQPLPGLGYRPTFQSFEIVITPEIYESAA